MGSEATYLVDHGNNLVILVAPHPADKGEDLPKQGKVLADPASRKRMVKAMSKMGPTTRCRWHKGQEVRRRGGMRERESVGSDLEKKDGDGSTITPR